MLTLANRLAMLLNLEMRSDVLSHFWGGNRTIWRKFGPHFMIGNILADVSIQAPPS